MEEIQLFISYLRSEKRYSEHTTLAYNTDLSQFIDFLSVHYPNTELETIGLTELRSWQAQLNFDSMDPRSVRRKMSSLGSFFRFLMKRRRVKHNPMLKLISPKIKKRLPQVVRQNDLADLNSAEGIDGEAIPLMDQLILNCLYVLGLRRAELITLKMKNLDLGQSSIKVSGKGGKERIIPFGKELNHLFSRYILERPQSQDESEQYLFLLKTGRHLYPKYVYRLVHSWLSERTTISKRSPHVLRHSFATHLADHGADINAIKNLLGHSSLAATQVYMHNSVEQLKKVYGLSHPKAKI